MTTINICGDCGWEGEDDDLRWICTTNPMNGGLVDYSLCPECGSDRLVEEEI